MTFLDNAYINILFIRGMGMRRINLSFPYTIGIMGADIRQYVIKEN